MPLSNSSKGQERLCGKGKEGFFLLLFLRLLPACYGCRRFLDRQHFPAYNYLCLAAGASDSFVKEFLGGDFFEPAVMTVKNRIPLFSVLFLVIWRPVVITTFSPSPITTGFLHFGQRTFLPACLSFTPWLKPHLSASESYHSLVGLRRNLLRFFPSISGKYQAETCAAGINGIPDSKVLQTFPVWLSGVLHFG